MTVVATLSYLLWRGADIDCLECVLSLLCGSLAAALMIFLPVLYRNMAGNFVAYLCLGVIPAVVTSYIAAGAVYWSVLVVALPLALLSDGIIHSVNTRNVLEGNQQASLAKALGAGASAKFYAFEMIFPFVWVAVLSMIGLMPVYTIVVFLAIAVALACAKTLNTIGADETDIIGDIAERTANLHLMFSILLSLSFIAAYFL